MQAVATTKNNKAAGFSLRGLLLPPLVLAISGCAVLQQAQGPDQALQVSCTQTIQPEHQLQLDAVDSLMARSQPYAGLARLESEGLETRHHWLRKGQLLAATGQLGEAREVFQALAERCQAAGGYHGLGLVYLKLGQLDQGLAQLEKARQLEPSSADIRNDYGYGLLLSGRDDKAVFELRTAFELADGQGGVRQNLAAAYLITGDRSGLKLMRDQYDFATSEYAHAKKLADEIRSQR
ncbi:MAG: hypothetical protein R3280_16260 [Marinobacter sp.]|uniref:tetratricopeptide repeat protein n=1 Tax=Marinobacter sp. TaxID=50741 RepID=UPI00299E0AF1|nr:tetratricopeptide repeat protein [Marinobacter sp.]MDX1636193.1 hypothetical protein [Marinobacter sp.]